jgi:transcriptional regulator with XRE-family HTH domain
MQLEMVMPINDRLKELRAAAGLTQQQLAVAAGLSVSAVTQIEAGKIPDPRVGTLRKLARALGVTLDDLAPDEEPLAEEPKKGRGRKGKGV